MNDFATPTPDLDGIAYRGSIQQVLSMHLGEEVRCDFLVGSNQIVSKTGILYSVAEKFIVLFHAAQGMYTVCDVFNLKFVTFLRPGAVAPIAASARN